MGLIVIAGPWWSLSLTAQSPSDQARPSESPDWETAAGGKMAFDVASVKVNKLTDTRSYSNITMDPGSEDPPSGGLFSATKFLLNVYVAFAYKISPNQTESLLDQMPKWATAEKFDIQARASGNPTKDQMRLMMQSLLAERFHLVVHRETRQLPVLALTLVKPGKTGSHLRPHSDDPACFPSSSNSTQDNAASTPSAKASDEFPEVCDKFIGEFVSGRWRVSARNMSVERIASIFSVVGAFDRPVLDQTKLYGKFDFSMEFTPEFKGPPDFQPDSAGPTFLEALRDQLGLKLEPRTGPVDVLVIDHVEQPSEN
jgi:uncharacterized protein (TIGR03435 family)